MELRFALHASTGIDSEAVGNCAEFVGSEAEGRLALDAALTVGLLTVGNLAILELRVIAEWRAA